MEQNLSPVSLTPTAQVLVAALPAGLYAVGDQTCRSWSEAVAALAEALGVERKPRKAKAIAGTGRPPAKEVK